MSGELVNLTNYQLSALSLSLSSIFVGFMLGHMFCYSLLDQLVY